MAMRKLILSMIACTVLLGCSNQTYLEPDENEVNETENEEEIKMNQDTKLSEVINHPLFEGFGRFLFPINRYSSYEDLTLSEVDELLPYHSHIQTDTTLEVLNYMQDQVKKGNTIFYDIYSEEEKREDPSKENTGLFFFQGEENTPFAIVNAGGGFSYVGSIHESFPHALEISKHGYNGFALQYRTGGAEVACEDLAAAIAFIFENAEELGVDKAHYSLWGGSAGARMAAYLGSYGTAYFGQEEYPRPSAVIIQYTGHSEVTNQDPATYVCVGENDGIASWRTMQRRIEALDSFGIDTEFHVYPNLGHGFGLGIGTSAEGWIEDAIAFWETQMIEEE